MDTTYIYMYKSVGDLLYTTARLKQGPLLNSECRLTSAYGSSVVRAEYSDQNMSLRTFEIDSHVFVSHSRTFLFSFQTLLALRLAKASW